MKGRFDMTTIPNDRIRQGWFRKQITVTYLPVAPEQASLASNMTTERLLFSERIELANDAPVIPDPITTISTSEGNGCWMDAIGDFGIVQKGRLGFATGNPGDSLMRFEILSSIWLIM